jgi:hypothetical protein
MWSIAKPVTNPELRTRVQWVADMLNASERIAAKIGISPEAVVAQAALESGWGASKQGQFGLFGQKADPSWKGNKVLCRTREFVNGDYIVIDDWFRDYTSLQDCIEDHFKFLDQNSRYRDAGVFDRKGDEHFFFALQKAGYATDPHYANSLIAVQDTIADYFMPYLTTASVVRPPRALLMMGSSGPDVSTLQSALAALGWYKGTVDGRFGPITYNAVVAFQKAKVLAVDGVVGDETLQALKLV